MASTTPFFKAFGPLLFGRPAVKVSTARLKRLGSLADLYDLFGHLFGEKLLDCTEAGVNSRARILHSLRDLLGLSHPGAQSR